MREREVFVSDFCATPTLKKKNGNRHSTLTFSHCHLLPEKKIPSALAERIAAGRAKGLPYREIEEQLFREVTPSFAEEERERLRLLVEEVGRGRGGGDKKDDDENNSNAAAAAAAPKKKAAPKKAPKKKGG